MRKLYHVFGLGYGDEGKGTIVDSVVRKTGAGMVVRYNGGPQAAHNVVEESGRSHCFSQFGSGTLVPDVRTHLSSGMLIKPQNLLSEAEVLGQIGIADALERLSISPDCYLVTPWHAAIGQMLEVARESRNHGSVGMGVGQAVLDRCNYQCSALTIRDLLDDTELKEKLTLHCEKKLAQAKVILGSSDNPNLRAVYDSFLHNTPEKLLTEYREFIGQVGQSILSDEDILGSLAGDVVFEGAQGVLLDPFAGFAPHVTKTVTLPVAAQKVAKAMMPDKVTNIGVTRGFSTRHGRGPLVTEADLSYLAEGEHNSYNRWQGSFRYGYMDLVALRYAIDSAVEVDLLAVTCLDRLRSLDKIENCVSYEYVGSEEIDKLDEHFNCDRLPNGNVRIWAIKADPTLPIEKNLERTKLLAECRPLEFLTLTGWNGESFSRNADRFLQYLDFLESGQGVDVPVAIAGFGPTAKTKWHRLDITRPLFR